MKTILFQGDSITGAERNRTNSASTGQGYACMVAERLGFDCPNEYLFLNKAIGRDCIDEKNYKYFETALFLVCLLLIMVISGATTMYNDDFLYGTFFEDGLNTFVDMTVEHYLSSNGRAFVHFVLEIVLVAQDRLFFIVIPLLTIMSAVMFFKACVRDKLRISATSYYTYCLMGIMCLSPYVLREGMLWMSGAMNYIFPLIFSFAALYIVKRSFVHKTKWYLYPLALLCGATTEQGGAIAIGMAALYVFFYAIKNKVKPSKETFFLTALVLLGYVSIFLSPATLTRLLREGTDNGLDISGRLQYLLDISFGEGGMPWLFFFTELLLMIKLAEKNKIMACAGIVLSVVATVMILCGTHISGGILLVTGMFLSCLALLCYGLLPELAISLAGALCSVAMMVFSTSCGYRNLLPAYIIMICISSALTGTLINKRGNSVKCVVGILLFAVMLTVFYPTLSGYIRNRRIINENMSEIKSEKQEISYNVGIENMYGYNQFFEEGFYVDAFKKIYSISTDKEIYIYGRNFENLYCRNVRCVSPAYRNPENGIRYLPMRDIIDACGGNVSFDVTKKLTTINVNGLELFYDNAARAIYNDSVYVNMDEYRAEDYSYGAYFLSHTYFEEKVFTDLFGLNLSDLR